MSWKKVITSGSNAELNHISASSLRVMPLSDGLGGDSDDRVLVLHTASGDLRAITQSDLTGINTTYDEGYGIDIGENSNELSIETGSGGLHHDLVSGSGGTTVFPGSHIDWTDPGIGTLDPGNYTNSTYTGSPVGNGLNVVSVTGDATEIWTAEISMDPNQGTTQSVDVYTAMFNYNDLDTTGDAYPGNGRYALSTEVYLQGDYDSGTGQDTDFSGALSLLINGHDADGVSNQAFYNDLNPGDLVTFWVSADRWYQYRITVVDPGNPNLVDANNVNHFGITFLREVITNTETAIDATVDLNVQFRFLKQADFITGITEVGALNQGSIGEAADPANFNIHTTGSIQQASHSMWTSTIEAGNTTVDHDFGSTGILSASVISSPAATMSVSERLAIQGLFTYNNLEFSEAIYAVYTGSESYIFGSELTDSHSFTQSIIVAQHLNAAGYTGSGEFLTNINPANVDYATLSMGNGISGEDFNFQNDATLGIKLANTGSTELEILASDGDAWDNHYRFSDYLHNENGNPVTTASYADGITTIEYMQSTDGTDSWHNSGTHTFSNSYNLDPSYGTNLENGKTYQMSITTRLRALTPDPTLIDNPTSFFSSNSNTSKEYMPEAEGSTGGFLRVTYSTSGGNGLYIPSAQMTWDTTGTTRYRVKLRVKGTKADGVTPQGSTFDGIGINNDIGTAVSNPSVQPYWQDYEFADIQGNADYFRFYLQSSTIDDIVDFDIISVALDASYGIYMVGGNNATPDGYPDATLNEINRWNNKTNTAWETVTLDFMKGYGYEVLDMDYPGVATAYIMARFFDTVGMKVDISNVSIKEVTDLRWKQYANHPSNPSLSGIQIAPMGVQTAHLADPAVTVDKIKDGNVKYSHLTGSLIQDHVSSSFSDNSLLAVSAPDSYHKSTQLDTLRTYIQGNLPTTYNDNIGTILSVSASSDTVQGLYLSTSGDITTAPTITLTGSATINNAYWATGSADGMTDNPLAITRGGTGINQGESINALSAARAAAINIFSHPNGFIDNAITIGIAGETSDTITIPGSLTVQTSPTTIHTDNFSTSDNFMLIGRGSTGGQTIDSGITFGNQPNSMNTIIFDSGLDNVGRFALMYDYDSFGNLNSGEGTANTAMSNNSLLGVFSGSAESADVQANQDGNMLINAGDIYFHI